MDYAEEKYGKKLVEEIKALLRVLVLYLPLPVFWSLYDQQGSGWTFQARRMNGDIGFYTILPDQMQLINSLLVLTFIPLFQYVVYPLMSKCNFLTTPLKRITVGGLLVAVSFFVSASISLAIEAENPELPSAGQGQLRIYNNVNCNLKIEGKLINTEVKPYTYYEKLEIEVGRALDEYYRWECGTLKGTGYFNIREQEQASYYVSNNKLAKFVDSVEKDDKGKSKIR